jgi:hypothetical protein
MTAINEKLDLTPTPLLIGEGRRDQVTLSCKERGDPPRRYGGWVRSLLVFAFLISPNPTRAAMPFPGAHGRSISIGDLTFTGVFPRIFTPNGDGYNDKAVFHFTNPEQLPLAGMVFDISGAEVASLAAGSDPTSLLVWDGKDTDGRTVPGGIYIYRIDFQGKVITGTVVVAR